MKVLLVNPAIRPESIILYPNVGLAYIADALHRAGVDLDILDIDAHRYPFDEACRRMRSKAYDVVGLGTLVSQYSWVKSFAREVRQAHPRATIVAGNTVGTSISELLLQKTEVDVAVHGEGDVTVVELVEALAAGRDLAEVPGLSYKRDGRVHRTPERPVIEDVNALPYVNYDLWDIDIYVEKSRYTVADYEMLGIPFEELVAFPISSARGCPFKCTFCYHAFQNKRYRYRSPENLVGEIRQLKSKYGVNVINFWDELSFFHKDVTEKLVDHLLEADLGVHWYGTCRSELFRSEDRELARKMKQSGCMGLGYALESGNDAILQAMNKRNTSQDFIKQSHLLQEAGIRTYSSIVLGYPQETEETIAETFSVLKEARVYASVGYLQPMPGTPMYARALEMGVIADEEEYLLKMGDRQDLRVNLTGLEPAQMETVVEQHLVELNEYLKLGLERENLIKTTVYRSLGMERQKELNQNFLQDFGVSGRVLRGETSPSC